MRSLQYATTQSILIQIEILKHFCPYIRHCQDDRKYKQKLCMINLEGMGFFFKELIEYVKSGRIFQRNKRRVEIKVLSVLLYFFGISFRRISEFLSSFEEISHETVRICYHKIKEVLKQPEKKKRRLVAIDENYNHWN